MKGHLDCLYYFDQKHFHVTFCLETISLDF